MKLAARLPIAVLCVGFGLGCGAPNASLEGNELDGDQASTSEWDTTTQGLSVFAASYVGCYTDSPTRALPVQLSWSGSTVESCIADAAAAGYKYAGLQWYGQCFAGDSLAYDQADDSSCNTPCDADPSQMCGGAWHNSVYRTPFSAPRDGFTFQNDGFTNDFVPALDIRTRALCGGMAYAALDYYYADIPIPDQPFRPAAGTLLRSHIYNRQVNSIMDNLDKWGELLADLGGVRNGEFFNWGISARIVDLRQYLDQGLPCVLGMKGANGEDHQVVAFDYEMGRYRGDLGPYAEDFKIYVYDPNHSDGMRTLIADRPLQVFRLAEDGGLPGTPMWRTYFVDGKYRPQAPPSLVNPDYPNDGLVHELVLRFNTGADDLRGGNDNIDLVVNVAGASAQTYPKINLGARWVVNSEEFAQVVLNAPVSADKICSITVRSTFGGGISGDNWDMDSLGVFTRGDAFNQVTSVGYKRFSGQQELRVPISTSSACVCTPTVTSCSGRCGPVPNGCGGYLNCAPCGCKPTCIDARCGASDGCGGKCMGWCSTGRCSSAPSPHCVLGPGTQPL